MTTVFNFTLQKQDERKVLFFNIMIMDLLKEHISIFFTIHSTLWFEEIGSTGQMWRNRCAILPLHATCPKLIPTSLSLFALQKILLLLFWSFVTLNNEKVLGFIYQLSTFREEHHWKIKSAWRIIIITFFTSAANVSYSWKITSTHLQYSKIRSFLFVGPKIISQNWKKTFRN